MHRICSTSALRHVDACCHGNRQTTAPLADRDYEDSTPINTHITINIKASVSEE